MWLLLAVPIVGVLTVTSLLLKRIRSESKYRLAKTVSTIIATVLIVFCIVILFLSMAFSSIVPDYPVITKQINDQYYFTQQEYGWVTSMPGKHVYIYRNKFWGGDQEVGHIDKYLDTGDLSIEITAVKENKVKLSLLSEQSVEMDTVIDLEKQYLEVDRSYWDRRKQKEW